MPQVLQVPSDKRVSQHASQERNCTSHQVQKEILVTQELMAKKVLQVRMEWLDLMAPLVKEVYKEKPDQRYCDLPWSQMYKCINEHVDWDFNFSYFRDIHSYDTHNKNNICKPSSRHSWGQHRFIYHAAIEWNDLPIDIRNCVNFSTFRCLIRNN